MASTELRGRLGFAARLEDLGALAYGVHCVACFPICNLPHPSHNHHHPLPPAATAAAITAVPALIATIQTETTSAAAKVAHFHPRLHWSIRG